MQKPLFSDLAAADENVRKSGRPAGDEDVKVSQKDTGEEATMT
uniref:Uncharacterized protein n=1 Tax=Rhizophora mucronata TaxID=61149 RepID=A0A2P2K2N3_RHIMU